MENKLTDETLNIFNGTYHGIWFENTIKLMDYKGKFFYTFQTLLSEKYSIKISVTIKNHRIIEWDYL